MRQSQPKSCDLDPIPTKLLKSCLPALAPVITSLVNSSIIHSKVPSALKTAFVTPILKRQEMNEYDVEDLNNYRPITNLPFCSKVLERVVTQQLSHHLSQHQLNELTQSAYRQYHGTETALTRVQNDILLNADKGHISILISLDLSAAFDALDHQILLQRLDSI